MMHLLLLSVLACRGRGAEELPTWGEAGLDARPVNLTCVAPPRPVVPDAAVRVENAFPALQWGGLVGLVRAGPAHWYAVVQSGRVHRFADVSTTAPGEVTTAITIPVTDGGERGLLGFALHPRFGENGYAYANLTRLGADGNLHSLITRYQSSDGGVTFPVNTETVLIDVIQPASNHNGGQISFGPDGFLYIAFGDGGGGNDTFQQAQDVDTLLGAILRIDVDGPSGNRLYRIPADNPFANGGGRPEIFAYGLRNPWRFSFDRVTGALWAGDVGQDAFEEIDIVPLGGNMGWPMKEGFNCRLPEGCDGLDVVDPVGVYAHPAEQRSITGGFVYRGTQMPGLTGTYVYADLYAGELRGLRPDGAGGWLDVSLGANAGVLVSSFAEDVDGELLVLGYGPGRVLRMLPAEAPPMNDGFPTRLSETGCMDPTDARLPAPGLIPYAPVAPFWSDGAGKARWLAMPEGAVATVGPAGHIDLPIGSVLVKAFAIDPSWVETRLLVRHADGGWAGYSYAWDEGANDGFLLADGATVELPNQTWEYPTRSGCMACHTEAAGVSLGLETAQLNAPFAYPGGRTANQLHTLHSIGLLDWDPPASPALVPALVDPHGEAALETRARAWLHTNCASCHRPESGNRTDLDLRFDTPLADTHACEVAPELDDLGLADPYLIAPGEPERSALWVRMAERGAKQMPPLGSRVVDEAGAALIAEWITSLEGCD